MSTWRPSPRAIACAMCAAIACSQSRTEAASAAGAEAADAYATGSADTSITAPIDCHKVFSPSDAAGLIKPPVTITAIGAGTGWCSFGNELLGNVTVRTGSAEDDEMIYDAATVSSDRVKYVPLPGVGDRAVRKASDGREIASKKGNLYCSVSIAGGEGEDHASLSAERLAQKLGALCKKVFSAM